MKILLFIFILFNLLLYSSEKTININFENLEMKKFVKITSKIIRRNILVSSKLEGKVNFISNEPLSKDGLLSLFIKILNGKNLTLVEDGNILKIIPFPKIDNNKVTKIIKLKNIESKEVMPILQTLVTEYKDKPFVSFEHNSNSIVLMGKKSIIKEISDLIMQLDIKKTQIFVEARIIEISENKTKDVGIKYGLSAGKLNSSSLFTLSSSLNGGNSIVTDSSLLSSTSLGLSKFLALGATINLLKENQALEIVSEPSILCLDNKESSIYVGETRSIKTGTTLTNGGNSTESYSREDIGLKLSVKPRVLDNEIILDINTVLEDIKQINALNGNPNTLKKEINTSAIVKDGESVVLGGLIKNKLDIINEEVPFFSDIPLLGNLFKNKKDINDKINLVIIITPYIIHKNENLTIIRDKLAKLKLMEHSFTQSLKLKLEKNKPTH